MRSWIAGLLSLSLAAGASAQVKIAFDGDPANYGTAPQELQSVLGSKYAVLFDDPKEVVADFIIASCPIGIGTIANADQLDRWEPSLRRHLAALAGRRGSPKVVLLLPSTGSADAEALRTYTIPLATQAAREAGAALLQARPDEVTTTANGSRLLAYALANAIVPSSIKQEWSIIRTDSYQPGEGDAKFAIDGNPDTYWHTRYSPGIDPYPHELVIDLGQSLRISGLTYLPRQDGGVNGTVKEFEIYVGDSATHQATLAGKGIFREGQQKKTVRFRASVRARYLRFVALSEQNGGPWASAAELDIIRAGR